MPRKASPKKEKAPSTRKTAASRKKGAATAKKVDVPEVVQLEGSARSRALSAATSFDVDLMTYGREVIESATDVLKDVQSRRKGRAGSFRTMDQIRRDMIFLPHLYLQYVFRTYGFPYPGVIGFMGATGVGKTSLLMQFLAACVIANCPPLYLEVDGKPIDPERALHFMWTTDPKLARDRLRAITFQQCRVLAEMEEKIMDWVLTMRGCHPDQAKRDDVKAWPIHIPLAVAVDGVGKQMSAREASMFYNWKEGDNPVLAAAKKSSQKKTDEGEAANEKKDKKDKEKFQSVDEISKKTTDHAVFLHGFSRRLTGFLSKYNVLMFTVDHQNDNFNMSGQPQKSGGPAYLPAWVEALKSDKKRGGRGMDQIRQFMAIIVKASDLKVGTRHVGHRNVGRVTKNSNGEEVQRFWFDLVQDTSLDRLAGVVSPGITFDNALAELLVESKLFGCKVTNKVNYSSSYFKLENVSAHELSRALHADEAATQQFGQFFDIRGYNDIIDKITDEAAAEAPKAAPPIAEMEMPEREDTGEALEEGSAVEEAEEYGLARASNALPLPPLKVPVPIEAVSNDVSFEQPAQPNVDDGTEIS